MLATDQTFPILDYEPFESFMKKSELAARENSEQVAVEIPEDLAEVEIGRIAGFRREHAPQYLLQRPWPISQHGCGGAPDLGRHGEVCGGEKLLFPA
jgi:hypothetical protein